MNKPPVLSDEELLSVEGKYPIDRDLSGEELFILALRLTAQAQRDDTWQKAQAYYEPLIQQARQDTAREIFEEIEELGKHRRRTSRHVVNYITINHKNWNALKDRKW